MDEGRLKMFKKTAYWQETNHIVQHCFAAAERKGLSLTQFAHLCDLSPQTVRKNVDQDVGLRQELTLWKLCAAVGLKVNMINRAQNGVVVNREMAGIRKALDRKPQKKRKKQRGKKRRRTSA